MTAHVIRSAERYHHETGGLSTYWHFSFDHYHDPTNVSFGPLRAFNDERVGPGRGFPPHSHADMEIVSYVLSGTLERRDDTGTRGRIGAGELQVMSAGTGITHAEYNPSATEPVRVLQIWVRPRRRGRAPRSEQRAWTRSDRAGRLLAVVGGSETHGLWIDQDATLLIGALDQGQTVARPLDPARRAYLYVIEGAVRLEGEELLAGDQARLSGLEGLELTAAPSAELLLIDLP